MSAGVPIRTCGHCGRTFPLRGKPARPPKYCKPGCRRAASLAKRTCRSCGERPPAPVGQALDICAKCHGLAYKSCWRKFRFADEDAVPRQTEAGARLFPYPCPLCRGAHASADPGTTLTEEWQELRRKLAAHLDAIGFDHERKRKPRDRFDLVSGGVQ